MEMGSGSLTESGNSTNASPSPSPPPDSINGLKFGRKIYFENTEAVTIVNNAAPPKSSSGSSSSSSRSGASGRKGHHGGGNLQQPPRCQVEGCRVDLSDAKAYYSRHKVCGIHSKSPIVIVAGLQQRFCQQCSRFHQLPEFDLEKRSCRRRLAGHNERRRKPPPGSVLSPRYGRVSSAIFDNSNRTGGFLLDFSAYARHSGRDAWANARLSALEPSNQPTVTGRSVPSTWLSSTHNPPSNLYLQGSSSGTDFSSSGIPSGECFTGISIAADSSCALSLLSNQPWGSRNQASGLGMRDLANTQEAPMAQSTPHHAADVNQYPNHSWGFKSNSGASSSSTHEMRPDLGLGQIAHFSNELELSQQNTRQYMEHDHSRAYDSSTQHMHWSL